jgi:hypothetical protein
MKLIFIYGMPAVGKLTVAQELAAITGYRLFHNHLVVDLLLTVFEFGGPQFVALREEFWLSVFHQAAHSDLSRNDLYLQPRVHHPRGLHSASTVNTRGRSLRQPRRLRRADLPASLRVKRRMGSLSRHQHKKLTSVPLFEELHSDPAPKPEWLKARAPVGENYHDLKRLARSLNLHTVCESAHCPNIGECWHHKTATFMMLGNLCTRRCGFCAVPKGRPEPIDFDEPRRVAEAVATLGLSTP